MANRDFSDSVKLNVITENLRKNSGFICCSVCGKKLSSIAECHFDHIVPYAKGGKSTADNCQILCVNCNLKKSDKELADFILEEKAKKFLAGGDLTEVMQIEDIDSVTFPEGERKILDNMTKAEFDRSISDFISRKGDIHKVDFDRGYNHLPSIHYMEKYYGDIQALKKAFAVEDLSAGWNRETIRVALEKFVEKMGVFVMKICPQKITCLHFRVCCAIFLNIKGLVILRKTCSD